MTPLAHIPACSQAVVVALPRARGLAERLISLGLTPGAELRVLQNRGRGPLIIEVHGARLALGRGQAMRVAVEPGPQTPAQECVDAGILESGPGEV